MVATEYPFGNHQCKLATNVYSHAQVRENMSPFEYNS